MYINILILVGILSLVSCAPHPGAVRGWQQPAGVVGSDLEEALHRRSLEVQALKGRIWARVIANGVDGPSVRSDIYWLKDKDGGASFTVLGYGPFAVTIFEASMKKSHFQLLLPRDRVMYWARLGLLERCLARLVFDPWGIATLRGARCKRGEGGGVMVFANIQGEEIKGLFDGELNPIYLATREIKIAFSLPEEIVVTISGYSALIEIKLRLSQVLDAKREEVLEALKKRVALTGFQIYPLEMLLKERGSGSF